MQDINLPQLSIFETSISSDIKTPQKESPDIASPPADIFNPLENSLKDIFFHGVEENTVIKMRKMFGEKGKDFSDEKIQCVTTEFQFLIDTWLDEFEKDLFSGMTLKEVLNEK